MKAPASPFAFNPTEPIIQVGQVFGTPVAVQGLTWLPLAQIGVWIFFTVQSVKKRTRWPLSRHISFGLLKMIAMLGSEWGHNLAHIAVASWIGKPVDVIRMILGMPVLIYHEPEHPSITPRQHILRSAAGPMFNTILFLACLILRRRTKPGTPARELVDTTAGMSAFITSAGLLPIPDFDGGPLLKWSLIQQGLSPERTAAAVQRVQVSTGASLLGTSAVLAGRKRWLPAASLGFLGMLAVIYGFRARKHSE